MKEEFSAIYLRGGWKRGAGETASGSGSTLNYTASIRAALPPLFERYNVKTLLDAPCGDFNWFSQIDLGDIRYTGMDIVPEMVAENQRRYGSPNREFVQGDLSSAALPKVDMMLCRDLMRHIKIENSIKVLKNFVASGTPWLLATSYVKRRNREIDTVYGSRPINLRVAPFFLPQPTEALPDTIEGFRERYLCLWTRENVQDALDGKTQRQDDAYEAGDAPAD